MPLFLLILLVICLVALVGVVVYAYWRLRRHLAQARQTPRPPGA